MESKVTESICTHPDHTDDQTCEERAVGCGLGCICCSGGNVMYIREEKE